MNTTPNTVIERITPEKAREYFNTSIGEGRNARPVSKTYIQSYADTMRKGRWMQIPTLLLKGERTLD